MLEEIDKRDHKRQKKKACSDKCRDIFSQQLRVASESIMAPPSIHLAYKSLTEEHTLDNT